MITNFILRKRLLKQVTYALIIVQLSLGQSISSITRKGVLLDNWTLSPYLEHKLYDLGLLMPFVENNLSSSITFYTWLMHNICCSTSPVSRALSAPFMIVSLFYCLLGWYGLMQPF